MWHFCAFPQEFHTKKLGEITVFFALFDCGWTMVTGPLLFYIARINQLSSSMEGENPVTYFLSMSQCILSLHVSNVSSMVLNWSTCLFIHKIVLVAGSFDKFTHHQFSKNCGIKNCDFWFQKLFYLRWQCFQILVNYFISPTTFVFIF